MKNTRLIDKKEYNKEELELLIKLSYKKLKSHTYYDNSNLFLRSKIAKSENNIDKKIDRIYRLITQKEEISINKSNVNFYCLPKNVRTKKEKNLNIVCNDLNSSDYSIDKITYFIDIDLTYHILGTMWVLLAGEALLSANKEQIYGNVLNKNFKYNDTRLFKAYHKDYSKWRDNAIVHSEYLLNNNSRCLMVALDIKDYYYSVNIDFEQLLEDLGLSTELQNEYKGFDNECISKKDLLIKLTKHIQNVLRIYSTRILKLNKNKKKYILPIGYMPSSILANWYLKEFDKSICEDIRPIYYGRYIDDMLLVVPLSKEIEIKNESEVIDKYFCKSNILIPTLAIKDNENQYKYIVLDEDDFYKIDQNDKFKKLKNKNELSDTLKEICDSIEAKDIEFKQSIVDIVEEKCNIKGINIYRERFELNLKKTTSKDIIIKLLKDIIISSKVKSDKVERMYIIKNKFLKDFANKGTILAIQNSKIKIYDFKPEGSRAVIDKFKNEIKKNASVFRFLPEKDVVTESFDDEVLEIIYSEGINKIRSIEEFKINKYNLSKFLAQVIYSEKLDNDSYSEDLENKILKLFNGMHIIEFYAYWEKAITCYLINNNIKYTEMFIRNVDKEIKSLENLELNLKYNIYQHKDTENIKNKLIKSLTAHLENTIAMIWALNDDLFIDNEYIHKDINRRKKIENLKDNLRQSNMLRHNNVIEPLMNYTRLVSEKKLYEKFNLNGLNLVKNQWEKDSINFGFRCTKLNNKINEKNQTNINMSSSNILNQGCDYGCAYELCKNSEKYTPRYVHLHEIILYNINKLMAKGRIVCGTKYIKDSIETYERINNLEYKKNYNLEASTLDNESKNNFKTIFSRHINDGKINNYSIESSLFNQNEINVNFIKVNTGINKDRLKIAVAHIDVEEKHYKDSIMKTPNLNAERLQTLYKMLNQAVKQGAEMIVFPEISIPYSWLSMMANFCRKHEIAIICGLEHVVYENGMACNYIATILPGKYDEYTYSIVKLRLKNHYAPFEVEMLRGYNLKIPTMRYRYMPKNSSNNSNLTFTKEYDLFRWAGVDFSCYNCFELSSLGDRGLFISYVDLLVGSVHNKDINHYSNVIESLSRDVHSYFVQVNNSRLGDNRIIAPKKTVEKNILQITGGKNDTILIGEINIKKLREFQLKDYNLQLTEKSFKPTPPEFNKDILKLRMNKPL